MDYTNVILGLVILGMGVWGLLKGKRENEKEILAMKKERDEYENLGGGLAEYNQKLQKKKELAKSKILEMLQAKQRISNRDVVRGLDVSDNSAVRYLDELEKEGRIKQVGKTGRNVFYAK